MIKMMLMISIKKKRIAKYISIATSFKATIRTKHHLKLFLKKVC